MLNWQKFFLVYAIDWAIVIVTFLLVSCILKALENSRRDG